MNRVCVFVDGSGFYFSLKRNNRLTRVDYFELSKALVGPDREFIRTYYYNSAHDPTLSPEQWKIQQPFLESLNKTPNLETRLGRLVPTPEGGLKERGTSIKLAADLVYYAAKDLFDTAIVVTEDTDFSHCILQAKELGKQVEVCLFRDNQPRELLQAGDFTITMDKVLEKYNSKIFPEAEADEDNFGNRIDDPPIKKNSPKTGLLNSIKAKLNNSFQ